MEFVEGKEYKDWENFGIRLKNARMSIGMTLEVLAEKTHRTENFISRIENGRSCSIHTLYQLCRVLNTSADDLLFGEKMENKEYDDKEIIINIIDKCDKNQMKIIKDVLVAIFPNFDELIGTK